MTNWDVFDLIGQFNRVRLESDVADLAFNTTSLELDYKRLLWGTRLEFYANAQLQIPHIEEIDYVLDSEFGLRYRLNQWARLSLLYELDQLRAYRADGFGSALSDRYRRGVVMPSGGALPNGTPPDGKS